MALSDESIEEFQRIWKQEYGKEITKEEASEYSENLVNFFMLLMEIDTNTP